MKQARLDILSTLLSAADGSSVDTRQQGCMAFDDKVNGRRGQGKGGLAVCVGGVLNEKLLSFTKRGMMQV